MANEKASNLSPYKLIDSKLVLKQNILVFFWKNLYYNSVRSSVCVCLCVCVCVCQRTPPRLFDGFSSFLMKRCFSYPDYTLSIFRELELNVKVTMAAKVTKSSTKKINFGLHTRVIAQNDRLTELNNYYIKTYCLKCIVFP